jgi:hypothetical protein
MNTRRIDEPDLPQDQQTAMILLHGQSPAVLNNDPPGARAGMFLGRLGGELVLLTEFVFLPIGFTLTHPEFVPGQKAPVFDHGVRLPKGADFHYASEGYSRSGFYLPDGNEVVPTVTCFMMVDHNGGQDPSVFRFTHTAYPIGRSFGSRAAVQTAEIAGEKVKGCITAKWRMTSVFETKNGKTYLVPKPLPFAKAGEAGYPLAQRDFAEKLRGAFKAGDDWTALAASEPLSLPKAEAATVVIEADDPQAHEPDESAEPKRSLADDLNDKVPF